MPAGAQRAEPSQEKLRDAVTGVSKSLNPESLDESLGKKQTATSCYLFFSIYLLELEVCLKPKP